MQTTYRPVKGSWVLKPIIEYAIPEPNRYHDHHFGCDAVKILPGEYFATPWRHHDSDSAWLLRVRGVCMILSLQIGGMNHFCAKAITAIAQGACRLSPLRCICNGTINQRLAAFGAQR